MLDSGTACGLHSSQYVQLWENGAYDIKSMQLAVESTSDSAVSAVYTYARMTGESHRKVAGVIQLGWK